MILIFIVVFLLLPESFSELSSEVISNVFISSNFIFGKVLLNMVQFLEWKDLLLHTWSLSVECNLYFTSLVFILLKNQIMKYFNVYFITLFIASFV